MNRITAIAVCGFALALAAPAHAATDGGYWVTKDGKIITSSKTGKCFKTRYWTPGMATAECKDKAGMSAMKK